MKINTITYYIKDAFKSLKRNKTISIASIITVLITFFILGIFLLVANNISRGIEDVQNKIDLNVVLKEDIKLIDQREIEIRLKEIEGVDEIVYMSKEDEFKEMNESMGENDGLMQGYSLQHNPFTGSFRVKLKGPEYAGNITNAIKDMEGVEKISGNQQEVVDKIVKAVKGIKTAGLGLFVVLIGVSIFLIMNTTKLTVYSRRREVGIMKFVGATDWFIRWPFIIEGMVIGLSGALLAGILLFFAYNGVFSLMARELAFVSLVPATYVLTTILWQFVIGGLVVGGVASGIALRKFLVV
ncbi:MAG: ABC transporter permease [Clostridium butyricum]|nr:ABC transporter permease [Clostridium butyricum]